MVVPPFNSAIISYCILFYILKFEPSSKSLVYNSLSVVICAGLPNIFCTLIFFHRAVPDPPPLEQGYIKKRTERPHDRGLITLQLMRDIQEV
jgi:hypothetical protein